MLHGDIFYRTVVVREMENATRQQHEIKSFLMTITDATLFLFTWNLVWL